MIPLKLELKNFLSYGPVPQIVDFGHHRLICLSGKNGHGKSALLDAMTWALWGHARKTTGVAKSDEHLLQLGQSHMLVSFDFMCNDYTYRIRREYAKTYGKPYASLDVGILEQETNNFKSLSDKTIRTTQSSIDSIVGLDYDTFINSAFLRQGQSHEFSQKSPKDRKNVLATILGLQQYELLRKHAMEKTRDIIIHKETVRLTLETIAKELLQKNQIIQDLSILQHDIDTLADQKKKLEEKHHEIAQNLSTLQEKEKEYIRNKQLAAELVQQIQEQKKELSIIFSEWRTVRKKSALTIDIGYLQSQKKIFSEKIVQHQELLQQKLYLKEKYLAQQEELQRIVSSLQHTFRENLHKKEQLYEITKLEQKNVLQHYEQLQQKLQKNIQEHAELDTKTTRALQEIENEKLFLQKAQQQEHEFERKKNMYHAWIAQANELSKKHAELKQRNSLGNQESSSSCPLCEQNLSAARKRFLANKFSDQDAHIKHRIQRFTRIIPQLKDSIVQQHATLTALRKQQEIIQKKEIQYVHDKNQLGLLAIKIDEQKISSSEQEKNICNINERLGQLQQQLQEYKKREQEIYTTDKPYTESVAKMTETKIAQEKILYDELAHKNDVIAVQKIDEQITQSATLADQLAQQLERKKRISELCKYIKQLLQQQRTLGEQDILHTQIQNEIHKISAELKELENQLVEINSKKDTLLEKKGSIQNQCIMLDKYADEKKQLSLTLKKIDLELDQYQTIAHAVSKEGIQALLIEDAIPEIEQEANALLSQLTDNQAHILIESLRDLKKGGTKETLDIKISDPMGIRPYELYSGGEAFRIDFALRIAISKLLARRAGTALQTLIIDEGFGSQDEEGLSRIMDAIYKIQDNFNRVIIVSHLPTMKEQFPVHFVVEKGAQGSMVKIIEQG